ncbi:hypothetical protein DAPPUDRAFT_337321 [Daphnia pulex]|uniref:Toprim domain-containing protein n=1 Tax=Daphnia pulex TaxID=6669 RepID=E9I1F1_DAPPU|nr:hypothetical protein DAPPUDRAFT_337321 [Daphnia pulex]|eukprot:EFX62178.1 hypothetical protein DAPPUDRAFT_337321 [Daphnia pulex]
MSFELEDFQYTLDELGITWRVSGKSLAIRDCPACGNQNYKVLFNLHAHEEGDEQFFGRCLKGSCQERYSSIKYLVMSGMSRQEALSAHNVDPTKMMNQAFTADEKPQVNNIIPEIKSIIDTSQFCNIEDAPDHFVSKYAKRRGYIDKYQDKIKIDLNDNSVVFLVFDDDLCIEYQKRFVSPTANPKTKMSPGFKRERLLTFHGGPGLVICEGPFTALSAAHYGFTGICTFGSDISKAYLDAIIQLAQKRSEPLYYALESDDAASNKGLSKFRSKVAWLGKEFSIIKPEIGKDLNDSWQAGRGYTIEADDKNPWIPNLIKMEW